MNDLSYYYINVGIFTYFVMVVHIAVVYLKASKILRAKGKVTLLGGQEFENTVRDNARLFDYICFWKGIGSLILACVWPFVLLVFIVQGPKGFDMIQR